MPDLSGPVSVPADAVPTRRRSERPRAPRRSSPLARIGFVLFALGLLAVVVIMVLFATGSHDLPIWLNLSAMLTPVGFGLGLLGVFAEVRGDRARRKVVPTADLRDDR